MKIRAYILAIMVGLLILQPVLSWFGFSDAYAICKKPETKTGCETPKKSCPTKKQCSKPEEPEEKKDCQTNGCNPFLGCASGNFYIHHYSTIQITSLIIPKQRVLTANDNRIFKNFDEFWHPPEMI